MAVNPPFPPITQEQIVANAHAELALLLKELDAAVERVWRGTGDWFGVEDVMIRLRHLDADARVAGMLLGMLSPWLPTVADVPAGTPKQVRAREPAGLEMGIRGLSDILPTGTQLAVGDEWRFPDLGDAVDWIVNQQAIASADDIANLQQTLHREAFTLDVDDIETVRRFQSALADSFRAQEPFAEFRKRVEDIASVTRSRKETIYRTNTKQAFLAGQTEALRQPRVRERFRWYGFFATRDNRTRETHWALNRMVAEVGSPLHRLMLQRLAEYNCRCTGIALDERKASRYGVKTLADVPTEFR